MINQIEHNVNTATSYVGKGEKTMATAVIYKRQNRRVLLTHIHANQFMHNSRLQLEEMSLRFKNVLCIFVAIESLSWRVKF